MECRDCGCLFSSKKEERRHHLFQHVGVPEGVVVRTEIQDVWVHVLNRVQPGETLAERVTSTLRVEGEICASGLGTDSRWFSLDHHWIALVFEGEASFLFSRDVYSRVGEDGLRVISGDEVGGNREEAWIVPSLCQVRGLIGDHPQLEEIAAELCLSAIRTSKRGATALALKEVELPDTPGSEYWDDETW